MVQRSETFWEAKPFLAHLLHYMMHILFLVTKNPLSSTKVLFINFRARREPFEALVSIGVGDAGIVSIISSFSLLSSVFIGDCIYSSLFGSESSFSLESELDIT